MRLGCGGWIPPPSGFFALILKPRSENGHAGIHRARHRFDQRRDRQGGGLADHSECAWLWFMNSSPGTSSGAPRTGLMRSPISYTAPISSWAPPMPSLSKPIFASTSFISGFPPGLQAIIETIGYLRLLSSRQIGLLVYAGAEFTIQSFEMGEKSGLSPWRPYLYPYKASRSERHLPSLSPGDRGIHQESELAGKRKAL